MERIVRGIPMRTRERFQMQNCTKPRTTIRCEVKINKQIDLALVSCLLLKKEIMWLSSCLAAEAVSCPRGNSCRAALPLAV